MKIVAMIFSIIIITACTPKLDTESEDTIQKSVSRMKKTLSDEEGNWLSASLNLCTDESLCDINDYNNMVAQDIIEYGRILKLEKMKSEADLLSQYYLNEMDISRENFLKSSEKIKEIGDPFEDMKSIDNIFQSVIIKDARLYKKNDYYMRYNVISLTIQNNWTESIKSVSVDSRLISPGRSVPWVEAPFSFDIDGGLEPGESRRITLEPNMFSELGKSETPKGAEFILTLTNIETADGMDVSKKIVQRQLKYYIDYNIKKFMAAADIFQIAIYLTMLECVINEFKIKCDNSIVEPNSSVKQIYLSDSENNYMTELMKFERELKISYDKKHFSLENYYSGIAKSDMLLDIIDMEKSSILKKYVSELIDSVAEIATKNGYSSQCVKYLQLQDYFKDHKEQVPVLGNVQ